MDTIVIVGGKGHLALDMLKFLPKFWKGQIVALSHEEVDITNKSSIKNAMQKYHPSFLVNCAALTNVDWCEDHEKECFLVNAKGAENMAYSAKESKCKLIHISSDFCKDPVNIYAKSKKKGEDLITAVNKSALIVRTHYLSHHHWILRELLAKHPITAWAENKFNPITSLSLTKTIVELIHLDASGIFPVLTENPLSYYTLALKVCEVYGLPKSLITPIKDVPEFKAPRPHDVFISIESLKKAGVSIYTIEEDLNYYRKES